MLHNTSLTFLPALLTHLQQEAQYRVRAGLRTFGNLHSRDGFYTPLMTKIVDQVLLREAPLADDWRYEVSILLYSGRRPFNLSITPYCHIICSWGLETDHSLRTHLTFRPVFSFTADH